MEILAAKHLTFTYPNCNCPVLSDLSFSVKEGEFAVLCGATGSGKSTLLRLFKREITPLGERSGEVLYGGRPLDALSPLESAGEIGFVMQKPEQQIVTDKVWHELAFGLENLNLPREVMDGRVAETAAYFGMEDWFERSVSDLSGGQKQLLNLASVMVMNPRVLILDEPTAQLDPIAASNFIATLKKLNRELSLTILIVEHRLEELIPSCDRLLVLRDGKLVANDTPRKVLESLGEDSELISSMPAAARLYHALSAGGKCPLTVGEGREFLQTGYENRVRRLDEKKSDLRGRVALQFQNVCMRYEKNLPDVLQDLSFSVLENEVFCILGGNGSGKTTALQTAAGLLKAYSGRITVFEKPIKAYGGQGLYRNCLALLPQDVQTVFLKNTVREELEDVGASLDAFPLDLSGLMEKHPYDLSGGEQQMVALAKVLACKPRLLLMDEPTKGLDAAKKERLVSVIRKLKNDGLTVVIVTHDVEFAALCADRCALFFRGGVHGVSAPVAFFSEHHFYTTAACRMSRGFYDGTVTVEQVAELCRLNGKRGGA